VTLINFATNVPLAWTLTGSDGFYAFKNVSSSINYTVQVSMPSGTWFWSPTGQGTDWTDDSDATVIISATTRRTGVIMPIQDTVVEGYSDFGMYRYATLSGTIFGASGSVGANLNVTLLLPNGTQLWIALNNKQQYAFPQTFIPEVVNAYICFPSLSGYVYTAGVDPVTQCAYINLYSGANVFDVTVAQSKSAFIIAGTVWEDNNFDGSKQLQVIHLAVFFFFFFFTHTFLPFLLNSSSNH
jgi:hypothetical protein